MRRLLLALLLFSLVHVADFLVHPGAWSLSLRASIPDVTLTSVIWVLLRWGTSFWALIEGVRFYAPEGWPKRQAGDGASPIDRTDLAERVDQ